MAVYTRKGDKGVTSSVTGKRMCKTCLEIKIYGDLDELNSFLGLLRTNKLPKKIVEDLDIIQRQLFSVVRLFGNKTDLSQGDVAWLEKQIDELDAKLKPLKNFVLPTGTKESIHAHIARAVCRRAERSAIKLSKTQKVNPLVIEYLNRLSDYLFVLARTLNKGKEVIL